MLPTSYSGLCAAALAVLTFAAMQVFRDKLGTEGKMSILGGFIGSWFFVFVLTVRVGRWGGGIGWRAGVGWEAKDRVVRADSHKPGFVRQVGWGGGV